MTEQSPAKYQGPGSTQSQFLVKCQLDMIRQHQIPQKTQGVSRSQNQKCIFGSILEGEGADYKVEDTAFFGDETVHGHAPSGQACSQPPAQLSSNHSRRMYSKCLLLASQFCLKNPFSLSPEPSGAMFYAFSCCHNINTGWLGCCPSRRPPGSNAATIGTQTSFLAI